MPNVRRTTAATLLAFALNELPDHRIFTETMLLYPYAAGYNNNVKDRCTRPWGSNVHSKSNLPDSPNFQQLADIDRPLAANVIRAELYVLSDPHAALMKIRCFTEMIVERLCHEYGLSHEQQDLAERINRLRFDNDMPRAISDLLHKMRQAGNEAAHSQSDDPDEAIDCLEAAHSAAMWYLQTFVDEDSPISPFVTPRPPRDASDELRKRLEDREASANAYEQTIAKLSGEKTTLVSEKQYLYDLLKEKEAEIAASEEQSAKELADYAAKLRSQEATPINAQSYMERSRRAMQSLGLQGDDTRYIPVAQIRVVIADHCCKGHAGVINQSHDGGFVKVYCLGCGKLNTLSRDTWQDLDVWVSCPKCRQRLEKAYLNSNYGFECSKCGWRCLLASILPAFEDVKLPYST